MIPLAKRSLDPETCVAQGGHCFVRHTTREVGPAENRYGQRMTQRVEVCRHCPAYRVGHEPPRSWVDWGPVQVRGTS